MESKRVLIVARTIAFDGLCVGAVTSRKWDPLRLLPPGRQRFWTPADAPKKGGVYQVEFSRVNDEAPHVEDVRLATITAIGKVKDLGAEITAHAPIQQGALASQFEGHLVSPEGKPHSLAIVRPNLPTFSTQFWRADEPLKLHHDTWDGKTTTRFSTADGIRIPWKSEESAPELINAGDIVRLSLAGWWNGACFLQISDVYHAAS